MAFKPNGPIFKEFLSKTISSIVCVSSYVIISVTKNESCEARAFIFYNLTFVNIIVEHTSP